jgi:hypothetical protein
LTFGLFCLAADWTLAGYWPVGLGLLAWLILSLFLLQRKFTPTLSLSLVLTILLAAIGLWRAINFPLALLSVFSILAAWDLDSFSRRLALAAEEDDPAVLERQHLLQLGLALLLAVVVSAGALFIRYESSFERAVILVVFTFGGIGALVQWLRRKES